MSLVPCPGCQRHIRVSERACPFCATAIASSIASKVIPGSTQRLSRAAAFAFTATLSLTNCGPSTVPGPTPGADAASDDGVTPQDSSNPDGTVRDDGGPMPLYGAPVDASRIDSATSDTGPRDDGGNVALYGAPVDAGGERDVIARDDGGGVMPLYGAVPAPDAGRDASTTVDGSVRDSGGVVPLYGALPPPDASTDDDASTDASIGVRYGGPVRPDGG